MSVLPQSAQDASVALAYERCMEITQAEARNFWYGIRLLDEEKRRALSAVYAFARRADDVADGAAATETKLAELERLRVMLDGLRGEDAVIVALRDVASRFPLPLKELDALIDGCVADVQDRKYQTLDELYVYCGQVAGSIGKLSVAIFGADGDSRVVTERAQALGIALQLTNILRDIVEDRRAGRVYLPAEELARFSVTLDVDADGTLVDRPEDLECLIGSLACIARRWYRIGLQLLPMLDRRSAGCCGAMAGIYHGLLHQIERDPLSVTRTRVSLPAWRKVSVALHQVAMAAMRNPAHLIT